MTILDSRDVLIRSLYLEIERLKAHIARFPLPGRSDNIGTAACRYYWIECSGGKRIKRKR